MSAPAKGTAHLQGHACACKRHCACAPERLLGELCLHTHKGCMRTPMGGIGRYVSRALQAAACSCTLLHACSALRFMFHFLLHIALYVCAPLTGVVIFLDL